MRRETAQRAALATPARPLRIYSPPPRGEVDHELIWGSLAALMFLAAWLLAPAIIGTRALACPFRELTGHPCMLCGGTHAMAAFVRGQWAAAWGFNPLAVAIGLAALVYLPYALVAVTAGRRWRPRVRDRRRLARRIAFVVLALALANWVWLWKTM